MNGRYTEYNLYEFKQLSAMCIVRMLKSNDEISNILRSTNINTQKKEVRSSVKGRTSIFGRYIYSTAKGAPFKPVNELWITISLKSDKISPLQLSPRLFFALKISSFE